MYINEVEENVRNKVFNYINWMADMKNVRFIELFLSQKKQKITIICFTIDKIDVFFTKEKKRRLFIAQ